MGSFSIVKASSKLAGAWAWVWQEERALQASYLEWHILSANYQMQHYTSFTECTVLCDGALCISVREQELFKAQLP